LPTCAYLAIARADAKPKRWEDAASSAPVNAARLLEQTGADEAAASGTAAHSQSAGDPLRLPYGAVPSQGRARSRSRLSPAVVHHWGVSMPVVRRLVFALNLAVASAAAAAPTTCLTDVFTLDDQRALAALRTATEAACPCATFTKRSAYQRCARTAIENA